MQESFRISNERLDCSGMAYDHHIWCDERMARLQHTPGVKCHTGFTQSQPQVKILTNAFVQYHIKCSYNL